MTHLDEMKSEFERLDLEDRDGLRAWFEKYNFYSDKRKAHILHIWQNEWFIKLKWWAYGKINNRPKTRRGGRSKNKYCTREWCYKHYVVDGLSIPQCAKLARIAPVTFMLWLIRFGIPTRQKVPKVQAPGQVVPVWMDALQRKIKYVPWVYKVRLRNDASYRNDGKLFLFVRSKCRYNLVWFIDESPNPNIPVLTADDTCFKNIPRIYEQYGDIIENKYPAHIAISRADLRAATPFEAALATHAYAYRLYTRGWVRPEYPENELVDDWDNLKSMDLANRSIDELRRIFLFESKRVSPGHKVLEHFFDIKSLFWPFINDGKSLRDAVTALLHKRSWDFDFHHLLITIGTLKVSKLRYYDPLIYQAVFQRLGITGKVYDMSPGVGQIAMACALEGLEYTCIPNTQLGYAFHNGFIEFSGLKHTNYVDGDKADCLMINNPFQPPEFSAINDLASKLSAKRIIVCVSSLLYKDWVEMYRPKLKFKVKLHLADYKNYYMLVW